MKAPKPSSSSFDPTPIVDKAISEYMTKTETPNVAVVLIFQGTKGFFYYPNVTPAPLTINTLLELGSITKVFTATMLAYNLGSMSLSDPVTKYLPYIFGQNAGLKNVTLQQLATHSSGMPNEIAHHPSAQLFAGQPPSSALIAWWQAFNSPPAPAPGTCWQYSNIGFVTLGFAVGGVNPNNYNQQLSNNILTPLGMTQTGASPTGLTVLQGNTGTPTQTTPATEQSMDLKSTGQDMTIFLDACINPSQSSIPSALGTALAKAQTPFYKGNNCGSTNPITFNQGLAWQISTLTATNKKPYTLIAKDGATGLGGFEAWIGFVPSNMGIVVVGNKFMNVNAKPPQSPAKAGRTILAQLLAVPPPS